MTTSNNPQSVKIARKRGAEDEEPPRTLIVQSQGSEGTASPIYYVRQESGKRRDISRRNLGENGAKTANGHEDEAKFAPKTGPRNVLGQRLFHLKVKGKTVGKSTGKRGREDVATFVEQKRQVTRSDPPMGREEDGQDVARFAVQDDARPLKRPSRQPRAKKVDDGGEAAPRVQSEEERRQTESLAEYLHEAALDEIQREEWQRPFTKAKVNAPKISGQRARELHRQRMESNRKLALQQRNQDTLDTDMSDHDYIFDTYVLAPSSAAFDTAFHSRPDAEDADVGYLVIAPEDQGAWEAYMDDDLPTEDEQPNSDEEDENAEDYYGADYPEDDLSSDDEFGRQAYGYRGHGGEESDGDGYESGERGVWSDEADSDDERMERMMNPFANTGYRGPRLGGVRRRLEGDG